jgi:hypothetical protein
MYATFPVHIFLILKALMILDEVYDALHYVTFSILLVMYEHEKITNIVGNYFGVS